MALATIGGSRKMLVGFVLAVASCAVASDLTVIYRRGGPVFGALVAAIALLIGLYMSGTFTLSEATVVATAAGSAYFVVVYINYRLPAPSTGVAGLALIASFDVGAAFASGLNAIVATNAVARNAVVIEASV